MRLRLLTAALAASFSFSSLALAANTDSLSSAQQQQVQQIVHDYLLNNPQILIQVSEKLQQQQEQQAQQAAQNAQKVIPEVTTELFNDKSSPIGGNAKGDVTLIEFFDYQCPHCKDMGSIIANLQKQDGNLKIIYKELPIFGADSQFAAAAALAAAQQNKYDAFHYALLQTPDPLTNDVVLDVAQKSGLDMAKLKADINSPAIQQELKNNIGLAQKLQLLGTPAFVVANTQNTAQSVLIPGTTSQQVLQGLIKQARNNKLGNS